MIWQLRYKWRQHLVDVQVETDGDDLAEAEFVGRFYLNREFGDVARYVYVKPAVVCTSAQMRAAQAPAPPAVVKVKKSDAA